MQGKQNKNRKSYAVKNVLVLLEKKKCEKAKTVKKSGKSFEPRAFQKATIYTATCVTASKGFPCTRSLRSEGQAWK